MIKETLVKANAIVDEIQELEMALSPLQGHVAEQIAIHISDGRTARLGSSMKLNLDQLKVIIMAAVERRIQALEKELEEL